VGGRARVAAREGTSLSGSSLVNGAPGHLSSQMDTEFNGVPKAFAVGAEGVPKWVVRACKESDGLVVVLETLCGATAMKVVFVL
jgi:hypothetical protein